MSSDLSDTPPVVFLKDPDPFLIDMDDQREPLGEMLTRQGSQEQPQENGKSKQTVEEVEYLESSSKSSQDPLTPREHSPKEKSSPYQRDTVPKAPVLRLTSAGAARSVTQVSS